MDVRLTAEQRQLREAAAELADDLGPGSVADLDDAEPRRPAGEGRRGDGISDPAHRDGASGVEVAIVAEEFARGLVDVPFIGPVLADDLTRRDRPRAVGACYRARVGRPDEKRLQEWPSRRTSSVSSREEDAGRWHALGAHRDDRPTSVGAARGTLTLAVEYAKVREQYGATIGSYQAVGHLLAESLALIEAAISVLRHAAWAVDELPAARGGRGRAGWPRSTAHVRR